MDGRATLSGVDLLALPPHRLMSVLTTLWMEWSVRDEDVRRAHGRFIGALAQAATPGDQQEAEADNPFPEVMREGPAGVIGGRT